METLGLENLADRIVDIVDEKHAASDKAKRPEVIDKLSTDLVHAVFVDGKLDISTYEKQTPRRGHVVQTIEDFAAACERWGGEEASLWVDAHGVTLVCDDEYRLDRVKMPAVFSEGYTLVSGFTNAKVFTQVELVALLRTKLAEYMSADSTLLGLVRKLKWRNSDEGHAVVNAGNASLGRAVEQELSGIDGEELPELFNVNVPIWQAPLNAFREKIRVDITIDFASQKFRLEVSRDSIAEALLSAQDGLKAEVVEALPQAMKSKILLGTV